MGKRRLCSAYFLAGESSSGLSIAMFDYRRVVVVSLLKQIPAKFIQEIKCVSIESRTNGEESSSLWISHSKR